MKKKLSQFLVSIAIPLLTGITAGFFTREGTEAYGEMIMPPLAPPAWLFPVVWTVLYLLMGISSYRILRRGEEGADIRGALQAYLLQLLFNFLWPFFFFDLRWYLAAFVWLVVLWLLILRTILRFWRVDSKAAILMFPYLLWVTFAGYLNFAVFLLN